MAHADVINELPLTIKLFSDTYLDIVVSKECPIITVRKYKTRQITMMSQPNYIEVLLLKFLLLGKG